MSISCQNNYTQSFLSTKPFNKDETAVQAMKNAKTDTAKNMRMAEITQGTVPYKEENDRLMRKMQFAKNRAEAMGEFYGSIQTAFRESGERGVMAAARVGNMLETQEAFTHTLVYKNMDESDTLVPDMIEVLEKKQKELEEQAAAKEEEDKKETASGTEEQKNLERSESDENALRSSANKITNTRGTSSSVNTGAQKIAAKQYKMNDNPKKNNIVNDIFTGIV